MQSKSEPGQDKTVDVSNQPQHTLKGHRKLKRHKNFIDTPNPPELGKKKKNFGHFGAFFWQFLSLSLSLSSPKHTQKPLISHFSQESRGSFLLSSSSPWSWYLGFEVQGCRCTFLATIYTHLISQPFYCFILLSNMFYSFSQNISCFIQFLACFMLPYHVYSLSYMFYCFNVVGPTFLGQDMPTILCLCSLPCLCVFCHVFVFGSTCSCA